MKAWQHFKTITRHRWLVRQGCFKVGLYWQGLVHDLSKYSPSEFWRGARYYQGTRSPNTAEREQMGYSEAWMHHKGRNKHHYEYWMDYSSRIKQGIIPAKMPDKYVIEMFIDRIAASKNYNKNKYKQDMPLKYYMEGQTWRFMHKDTQVLLELLLNMLAEKGEKETMKYIRQNLLKNKK